MNMMMILAIMLAAEKKILLHLNPIEFFRLLVKIASTKSKSSTKMAKSMNTTSVAYSPTPVVPDVACSMLEISCVVFRVEFADDVVMFWYRETASANPKSFKACMFSKQAAGMIASVLGTDGKPFVSRAEKAMPESTSCASIPAKR